MAQFGLPAINSLIIGLLAIVAGITIIAFPLIINYIIAAFMLAVGAIWILGGGLPPGIISIGLGIILLAFPRIPNYIVGIYTILLGLWFVLVSSSSIIGLATLATGIIIMIFPDILSYLFGIYLLIAGALAAAHYFGVF